MRIITASFPDARDHSTLALNARSHNPSLAHDALLVSRAREFPNPHLTLGNPVEEAVRTKT